MSWILSNQLPTAPAHCTRPQETPSGPHVGSPVNQTSGYQSHESMHVNQWVCPVPWLCRFRCSQDEPPFLRKNWAKHCISLPGVWFDHACQVLTETTMSPSCPRRAEHARHAARGIWVPMVWTVESKPFRILVSQSRTSSERFFFFFFF